VKMIEWVEPFGPNSEPVYCRVSEKTAVATQRSSGMQAKGYVYASDKDALEDFMIVRWAETVEDGRENLQ
jgi:hypothetical protein